MAFICSVCKGYLSGKEPVHPRWSEDELLAQASACDFMFDEHIVGTTESECIHVLI